MLSSWKKEVGGPAAGRAKVSWRKFLDKKNREILMESRIKFDKFSSNSPILSQNQSRAVHQTVWQLLIQMCRDKVRVFLAQLVAFVLFPAPKKIYETSRYYLFFSRLFSQLL